MEPRKTKSSKSTGNPRNSHSQNVSSRLPNTERVKSTPLVPQVPLLQSSERSPVNDQHTIASNHQGSVTGDDKVQVVTIVVLGSAGVGKSTFIQCALDLEKTAASPISCKKVALEGSISVVRLVELDVQDVDIVDNSLQWPETVEDHILPPIDGALLLYDIVDPSSIDPLPKLLSALTHNTIPTVLITSKCDHPPQSRRLTLSTVDGVRNRFSNVKSLQTALSTPETHKRCVSIMLRNIMLDRDGEPCSEKRAHRPRATTASKTINAVLAESKHGRVVSGAPESMERVSISQSPARQPEPPSLPKSPPPSKSWGREPSQSSNGEHSSDTNSSSTRSEGDGNMMRIKADCKDDLGDFTSQNTIVIPRASETDSARTSDTALSFNEMDNPMNDLIKKDTYTFANDDRPQTSDYDTPGTGTSLESLIDRLLSQPLSKSDWKFTVTFLCLYRKFAAPSELLVGVIRRFNELSNSDIPGPARLTARLRYLSILQDWITDYPGDFAHPSARRIITDFLQTLATYPEFADALKEISASLEIVCEDDDTEWACSDQRRSRASTTESFLTKSSTQSAASTITADSSTEDIIVPVSPAKASKRQSDRGLTAPAIDNLLKQGIQSTNSFQILVNTVEDARLQAQLLTPMPRHGLDKVRWHRLMDIPEEQIALELTRIDWILYSSLRPRDLVRHICLNAQRKERCKSLEYVNRMINQFNHVAFWIANMILLRDKPKHRAKALEKFMGVAWKLRYLNNYNSLGAIIAGVNGTAVHRLSQTRELVSPEVRKQFMRLEILMGTAKSHSAYRLGWQNTSTPRIPFLPLHRRDLVFAEEGNQTYIASEEGKRINWKKFEVMGDVIIGIRRSQEMPYPTFKANEELQGLILDGKFSKDED
ncbi:MAG: hypothetical protein Q9217_006939, partial [Psora testacea]